MHTLTQEVVAWHSTMKTKTMIILQEEAVSPRMNENNVTHTGKELKERSNLDYIRVKYDSLGQFKGVVKLILKVVVVVMIEVVVVLVIIIEFCYCNLISGSHNLVIGGDKGY